MSKLVILSGLSLALAAAGCSSAPTRTDTRAESRPDFKALKRAIEESQVIGPGYVLKVTHEGDGRISGQYEVDFEGRIKMPYKVTIQAAGLTPEALASRIASAYNAYFKSKAGVAVEVKTKACVVEVRGDVQKPGRYPVQLDTSLEEIVALAGGFGAGGGGAAAPGARPDRPNYFRVERPDYSSEHAAPKVSWFPVAGYFDSYDQNPEFLWRGGERIVFQKAAPKDVNVRAISHTVSVTGEVREPKEQPILPQGDLLGYITASGGPTSVADLSRIEIVRAVDNRVDSVNLTGGTHYSDIRPGDVILVRAIDTRPSTFDRALTYIQITTAIATSVFLLILL
jgi:protein involved in polysaccharide export with SLBB domain